MPSLSLEVSRPASSEYGSPAWTRASKSALVKNCVVSSVALSRWTLAWMWVVRPRYQPG
jgi:hypothetical protein